MIKFLADENISPLTADFLRCLGYDVVTAAECGLISRPDEEIIKICAGKRKGYFYF